MSTPDSLERLAISAHKEPLLLDTLRNRFGFGSDAQLAHWLGLDRTAVYAARKGRTRLGVIHRLKMLDRIGFVPSYSLVEALQNDQMMLALRRWEERNQCNFREPVRSGTSDTELVEVCRVFFGLLSDNDVAQFLGLKRTSISMIRTGKSGLGVLPRLRILEASAPELPYADVFRLLGSTEALIEVLSGPRAVMDVSDGERTPPATVHHPVPH